MADGCRCRLSRSSSGRCWKRPCAGPTTVRIPCRARSLPICRWSGPTGIGWSRC
jgi:hypothetical protein